MSPHVSSSTSPWPDWVRLRLRVHPYRWTLTCYPLSDRLIGWSFRYVYHSLGCQKTHDWVVDQLPDLFRTTHRVKTQQVVKNRGHHCGDIEFRGYLQNAVETVPLVLDLLISHDRWGRRTDPTLNGHLHYPNDLDKRSPLLRALPGGYSEFVRILFLQTHRETDRFFATSGVHLVQHDRGDFHYRLVSFSSQFKAKTVCILTKVSVLRFILNIDGSSIISKSHTHPSHSQGLCLTHTELTSLGLPDGSSPADNV